MFADLRKTNKKAARHRAAFLLITDSTSSMLLGGDAHSFRTYYNSGREGISSERINQFALPDNGKFPVY
jgi:hypothetical protein